MKNSLFSLLPLEAAGRLREIAPPAGEGSARAFRPAFQRGMRLVAVFLPERGIGPDPERPYGGAPAVSENMGRGRCQCAHLAAGGFYRILAASL